MGWLPVKIHQLHVGYTLVKSLIIYKVISYICTDNGVNK